MKKCECYHEVARMLYSSILEQSYPTVIDGECWGTKERDVCNCEGNRSQCDFYPEVKAKALKEKQDKEIKKKHTKSVAYVKDSLNFYLDSYEENGVVYIPKFIVEKMIEELEDK